MEHKKLVPEGVEWSPRYYTNYNRFQAQIIEKIKNALELGRIRPLQSENCILLFTTPKKGPDDKDSNEARFILNVPPRNIIVRQDPTTMPN
jgi:hypothetical protein